MIPGKYVGPPHLTGQDSVRKLVAVAGVTEEQQMVKRHVQIAEGHIGSKRKIVGLNSFDRPDQSQAVFPSDPVAFREQAAKFIRQRYAQRDLRAGDLARRRRWRKLAVAGQPLDQFSPYDSGHLDLRSSLRSCSYRPLYSPANAIVFSRRNSPSTSPASAADATRSRPAERVLRMRQSYAAT